MKGFFNVLELLAEHTGASYSSYYADVKDKLYKLYSKYETKFGVARSQRPVQPSAQSSKRKQAWERIFRGRGVVGLDPSPSCSPSAFYSICC
jgi:hypothetical protein